MANNDCNSKNIDKDKLEKNAQTSDSKTKVRKTLNVSLQKRNFDELNNIINSWEDEDLNVSGEVCKSILFKYDLENNSYIQTLLSTINLIKTNLKNKELFEESYENALLIALKNIISIKVNAQELSDFLEKDNYFDNTPQEEISYSRHEESSCSQVETNDLHSTAEIAYDSTENSKNKVESLDISEEKKPSNSVITWNIPNEPSIPSQSNKPKANNNTNNKSDKKSVEELLNQRMGGFAYSDY